MTDKYGIDADGFAPWPGTSLDALPVRDPDEGYIRTRADFIGADRGNGKEVLAAYWLRHLSTASTHGIKVA